MKFACIGGDNRQIEIAKYLINKGYNVSAFGLPKIDNIELENSLYSVINNADVLILPLPISRNGETVYTPLDDNIIPLDSILEFKPKIIFGGLLTDNFRTKLDNKKIKYFDYYKNEGITVKNAILTAEAAISIAISETNFSIYNSNCLIIGYGRIGKPLAKYLKTMGANVSISSRFEKTLNKIEADGYNAINTNECTFNLKNKHIIFNTAPSPILNENFFKNCNKNTLVLDLATDAGTDFEAAIKYEINAKLCPGLPGKFSPETAAKFIADEILNVLEIN